MKDLFRKKRELESSMLSEIKKRPNFLDYTKCLGILLVILAHFPRHFDIPFSQSPIWWAYHTIVLFHMPLFFIVSGMLMKETELIMAVQKISKRLLVPYVLICCIATVLGFSIWLLGNNHPNIGVLIHQIKSILMVSDSGYYDLFSSAMWFCIALAWIQLLFAVSFNKPIVRISALVGGVIMMYVGNILPFKIDSASVGFVFFIVGYYGKYYFWKVDMLNCTNKVYLFFVVLCLLYVTTYLNVEFGKIQCLSVNSMYFGNYPLLFVVSGISGTILVMILASLLNNLKSRVIKNFVETVSIGTIVVLGFHKIIAISIKGCLQNYSLITGVIYSFCCLIICYFLIIVIRKNFPIIIGGR